ncbi:MAG: arylsulfatase [Melioribacteraceae bacterium]|nr:arylsulfatase [Melioribacteraceae bacterium]
MKKKYHKLVFPLLIIVVSLLSIQCSRDVDDRPNIILILADDLGYGDLSCYGQKNFSTPNIDKLAEDGMMFTQHYAGATVCAPSRCVLLTGKHTGHAFTRGNAGDPNGYGQLPIPEKEETFAKYLKSAGYKTGLFGKWGLGNAGTSGDPLKHGFDYFFGYHDQVLAHNSYPEFLMRNNEKVYLNNKVKYLSDTLWHKGLGSYSTRKNDYSNDIIFSELVSFIKENKKNKFFAYFPTTIPHNNDEAETGKRFEVPDDSKYSDKEWDDEDKAYAALVEHLDMYVGKLEEVLKELNLSENTIVIFTSDNGAVSSLNLKNNGKLRGYKRDVYEGGIRIPMIAKWPSKIRAGSTSNHLSAFWDFFPTMCEAVNIKEFPKTDGISFLPELLEKEQQEHQYLYWEFHWWKPARQAIRKGNWKAVKDSPTAKIELYNLLNDISEKNNLANNNLELVEEFEKLFKSARTQSDHFKL